MPLLSGLAAGAANLFYPQETAFDGAALVGAGTFTTRLNSATQSFERRLTSIDYKIQRQQLHREDIRDLVELTTARMDIYHLVGTLLLAFCMEWYTNGELWELPVWFSDLFLISNYGAVGYLIMCVWLAMYAAVASRSIGTRLLTSYARLSLPTKKEIDKIKMPIFHNTKDAVMRMAGLDEDSQGRSDASGKFVKTLKETDVQHQGQQLYEDVHVEVPSEDNQQHFRRFREELPRWLVYDTWARVCMSFGMNQMLQSLSYFSLGIIWAKSPLAAIMSFVAINFLSTIILWLDIGDLEHSWKDYAAITLLSFLPPVLAIVLLLYELMFPRADDNEMRGFAGFMCTVCFWSHAAWLWYLVNLFWTAGSSDSRFQPGSFADVLEWLKHKEGEDKHDAMAPKGEQLISSKSTILSGEAHTSGGAFSALVTEEEKRERLQERQEINGGREIGVWKTTTRVDGEADLTNPDISKTNWLPVRMIKYFTLITITWWCMSGVSHGLLIALHKHNEFKDFTGNNVLPPLNEKMSMLSEVALKIGKPSFVQFPSGSNMLKVAALHCSDNNVWVSSKSAMYALNQQGKQANASAANLALAKDGDVTAVICGKNHGCDALSPPKDKSSDWMLSPLDGAAGRVARSVPVPHSWKVVTGAWAHCPEGSNGTCTSAWLAGWDGHRVVAAMLELGAESNEWEVHPQFEVDPTVGLCADGHRVGCGHMGHLTYDDVSALQMSADAKTLMVLSGAGIVDVWDLPKGSVIQRMRLGDSYTSMCTSGENVFLSRQGRNGPVVATMALPTAVANPVVAFTKPAPAASDKQHEAKAKKAPPVVLGQESSFRGASQGRRAGRAPAVKAILVAK